MALVLVTMPLAAQQARDSVSRPDSSRSPSPAPPWSNRIRYGGGPSVGAPPSDYTGATPPRRSCLVTDARGSGDMSSRTSWREASRYWLREVLSDTTDFGETWRNVLGGAPTLAPSDSVIEIADEATCRDVARIVHRDVLGWRVGPPPVVLFRVRDYFIAFPSNARMGEFGFAVGMNSRLEIQGVSTW